jgi:hypothetical protein
VNTGTATRGGEFFVQIISTVTNVATEAWAYRDAFEHLLNDTSALVTICTGVVPLLRHLFHAYRQETGQQQHAAPPAPPITITLEIDGAPVSIKTHDVAQAEAVLEIAQRFYHNHPEVARKASAHSKVKVKGSIAGRPPRQRR